MRRKQVRKFAEGVFTKQVIEDTIAQLTDEKFMTLVPNLPPVPSHAMYYCRTHCAHSYLYMAGWFPFSNSKWKSAEWMIMIFGSNPRLLPFSYLGGGGIVLFEGFLSQIYNGHFRSY